MSVWNSDVRHESELNADKLRFMMERANLYQAGALKANEIIVTKSSVLLGLMITVLAGFCGVFIRDGQLMALPVSLALPAFLVIASYMGFCGILICSMRTKRISTSGNQPKKMLVKVRNDHSLNRIMRDELHFIRINL